jgi:hypothetical protein
MTDKIFSDIDLFVITTIEPSFEPSYGPTFSITTNNTSSGFSYSGLTNYEKRIVIFTSLGGLMLVFMLITLFFHIKSRLMHTQNKEVNNRFIDILSEDTTAVAIVSNETNV